MKLYVEKLNLEFSGKEILNDISFSIQEGEFVSILGPSGCGKSTILNVLAGLIEDYSGSVFVDDEPITGISSHFAYMPQNDLLLFIQLDKFFLMLYNSPWIMRHNGVK